MSDAEDLAQMDGRDRADGEQNYTKDMIEEETDGAANRLLNVATMAAGGGGLASALMQKMSTALLARAFLPSPEHIKQSMVFIDLSIKCQIMLYELSSSLFWCSICEITVFLFSQMLFFTNPKSMAGIYFHFLHVGRGVVGLYLVKTMPNSHDMIKEIRIQQDEKIPFDNIRLHLIKATKACVDKFQQKCALILMIYAGVTAGTLVLDTISFFKQIAAYNSDVWESAFADVSLLFMACLFLCLDLYYAFWILVTKLKFPPSVSSFVMLGLVGQFKGLAKTIHDEIDSYQTKKESEINQRAQ